MYVVVPDAFILHLRIAAYQVRGGDGLIAVYPDHRSAKFFGDMDSKACFATTCWPDEMNRIACLQPEREPALHLDHLWSADEVA